MRVAVASWRGSVCLLGWGASEASLDKRCPQHGVGSPTAHHELVCFPKWAVNMILLVAHCMESYLGPHGREYIFVVLC
jgi:hypothetical protein